MQIFLAGSADVIEQRAVPNCPIVAGHPAYASKP
jgi:hypothetical protein